MFSKFYWAILPYAGRYAHCEQHRWYDVLAFWIVLIIPTRWVRLPK